MYPRLAALSTHTCKAHHRVEASAPMTSVAVAAARAQDVSAASLSVLRHPHHQRCDSDRIRQPRPRCSEVANGATTGCAAVCCCFPCVIVEVVVLAMVRALATLCLCVVRAHRRGYSASVGQASDIYEFLVDDSTLAELGVTAVVWPAVKPTEEMGEMEKEVWTKFYGTGFWRSPSQLIDEIR